LYHDFVYLLKAWMLFILLTILATQFPVLNLFLTIYKEILIIHMILHLNDKFMNVDLRLCHNLIMPWKTGFTMSTCHMRGFWAMCFFCMCQYKLFLEIDLDGVYKWMLLLKKKYVVIKVLSNKYETITCGVGPFK
jgi:hypothetical protein